MPKQYYTINPQIYDAQFWWKKNDIEFWKQIFNKKNNTILELASGTGRIGIPLVREGLQYQGIEISQKYCQYANSRIKKLYKKHCITNDDMRTFNLNKKFDQIFIGFNSWLHLLNEKDAVKCLQKVKQHMKSTSLFYIDIFVPSPLFLYRPNDVALRVLEFECEKNNQIIFIDEILNYNKNLEIANITWLYSNKEKKILFEFEFKMKMYYPETMNRLLIDNGFVIKNVWGDYNKGKFSENSNLQIYECSL